MGCYFKEKNQITLKIGRKGEACHQLKNLVKNLLPKSDLDVCYNSVHQWQKFWMKKIDLEFAWCWVLFTVQSTKCISVYNRRKKLVLRFFFSETVDALE